MDHTSCRNCNFDDLFSLQVSKIVYNDYDADLSYLHPPVIHMLTFLNVILETISPIERNNQTSTS